MPTVTETINPELTYCPHSDKEEDHCICPKCKIRDEWCDNCNDCLFGRDIFGYPVTPLRTCDKLEKVKNTKNSKSP